MNKTRSPLQENRLYSLVPMNITELYSSVPKPRNIVSTDEHRPLYPPVSDPIVSVPLCLAPPPTFDGPDPVPPAPLPTWPQHRPPNTNWCHRLRLAWPRQQRLTLVSPSPLLPQTGLAPTLPNTGLPVAGPTRHHSPHADP
jgi:hypothetical protein